MGFRAESFRSYTRTGYWALTGPLIYPYLGPDIDLEGLSAPPGGPVLGFPQSRGLFGSLYDKDNNMLGCIVGEGGVLWGASSTRASCSGLHLKNTWV